MARHCAHWHCSYIKDLRQCYFRIGLCETTLWRHSFDEVLVAVGLSRTICPKRHIMVLGARQEIVYITTTFLYCKHWFSVSVRVVIFSIGDNGFVFLRGLVEAHLMTFVFCISRNRRCWSWERKRGWEPCNAHLNHQLKSSPNISDPVITS